MGAREAPQLRRPVWRAIACVLAGCEMPIARAVERALLACLVAAAISCSSEPVRVDDTVDGGARPSGPRLLSGTGLYADIGQKVLSPGLIEVTPRYPLWTDGSEKKRWLFIPEGTRIDTTDPDGWVFPVGTKAFKEFRVGGVLVETRLLMKVREGRGNGAWWQAAYLWNDSGTDAEAVLEGKALARGTTHDVPDQIACRNCHGGMRDVLVGVGAIALSDPAAGQLDALAARGLFSAPLPGGIDVPGEGDVKDALGYLHGNCGSCHNDEAPRINTQTRMRLRLFVGDKRPEDTAAYRTTVGTVMKHPMVDHSGKGEPDGGHGEVTDVIVKGEPERSGLWLRMGLRDDMGMPPVGSKVVDDAGRETVRRWIAGWK